MEHKVLPGLEDQTGADIVLSIWSAPATTDTLAWQHVKRGVGYQLKRGEDLVASIKDRRAMYQLAKMRKVWEECWGVYVGDSTPIEFDDRIMGTKRIELAYTVFPYKSYLSHVRNWQRAGGMWLVLHPGYPFEQWVADELQRLSTDATDRLLRKPSLNLLPLTPQEETLATFPFVGLNRAHAIWNHLPLMGADQTLTQALIWLSDGFVTKVEGIGKGVVAAARKHLGLKDDEDLGLYTNNDFLQPIEKEERG